MNEPDDDVLTRELVTASLQADDPIGWFDRLYAAAEQGHTGVPWDHREPHRLLVEWAEHWDPRLTGTRTLVVGSGFGDDAAYLAGRGADTLAFDVSPTAVTAARRRFPDCAAEFTVADLFDPPAAWADAFDLVVESYTVQALPRPLRQRAVRQVARFVAPGGTLLVIATSLSSADDPDAGPPWPLTRGELDSFADHGLVAHRAEARTVADYNFPEHWLAEFRRPAAGPVG